MGSVLFNLKFSVCLLDIALSVCNSSRKSKKTRQWPKEKGQKNKQRSTKHNTATSRSSNQYFSWCSHKKCQWVWRSTNMSPIYFFLVKSECNTLYCHVAQHSEIISILHHRLNDVCHTIHDYVFAITLSRIIWVIIIYCYSIHLVLDIRESCDQMDLKNK
jgi:hypothetical protein